MSNLEPRISDQPFSLLKSTETVLSSQNIKQALARSNQLIEKFPCNKINEEKEDFINFEDFLIWKNIQPFTSRDFANGHICHPPLPLGEIPEQTLEAYLVEDALLCLIGCNGQYIHVNEQLNEHSERIFNLTDIPQSLRGLLMEHILPIAVYYSNVVRFIENNENYVSGRVNQALAAVINDILGDYVIFVSNLDERRRTETLTFYQLLSALKPQLRTMKLLSDITKKITEENARGGATLNILYKEYEDNMMQEELIIVLLSNSVKPYFQSLEKWIYSGYIFDPYNEFMIADDKTQKKNDNTEENRLNVQLNMYCLKKNRIPIFFSNFSEKILRSGKYLNIIKQCQSLISSDILPQKSLVNKELKFTNLRDATYLEIIDEAYNYSSCALLNILFSHYHIRDRYRCLKRYFLMEQGDFIVSLMDLCEDELSKEIGDVIPTKVNSSVKFSLRLCSKGKSDSYKDDITVAFTPYDVVHEMCKIHAVGSSEENAFQFASHTNILGFDAVTLTLKIEWPLSLVFTTKVMSVYQLLFRLLLKCKRVERELSRIWLGDKRFKSLERINAVHYTRVFHLRHRMLVFTQSLLYCLTEEIIEHYFRKFINSLKKVKNVDDVLDQHWNFLNSCLDECVFKCSIITSRIMRTLKVSTAFCEFLQHMRIYCMDAEFTSMLSPDPDTEYSFTPRNSSNDKYHESTDLPFEFNISEFEEKFDHHVLNLLKIIVNSRKRLPEDIRIARLFLKQNFNGYYTHRLQIKESGKHNDEIVH